MDFGIRRHGPLYMPHNVISASLLVRLAARHFIVVIWKSGCTYLFSCLKLSNVGHIPSELDMWKLVKYLHLFIITSGTTCHSVFFYGKNLKICLRSKMICRRIKSTAVWGSWRNMCDLHEGSVAHGNNCFQ